MKKFALNPPCPRPPLAPGQIADPTNLKRGEDYPDEWAKCQAKLAKQAKEGYVKEACMQAKCLFFNALTANFLS